VIEGESGVGKTRLAQEAIAAIGTRGGRILAAHPHAGEQGLGLRRDRRAAARRVRADLVSVDEALRADAARLLPELGTPPPGSLDEPGARLRFLETISRLILAPFEETAGVVWIDDLQWCDPASLDALA